MPRFLYFNFYPQNYDEENIKFYTSNSISDSENNLITTATATVLEPYRLQDWTVEVDCEGAYKQSATINERDINIDEQRNNAFKTMILGD